MNLEDIKEIGILEKAILTDYEYREKSARDFVVIIDKDGKKQYLDIQAGLPLKHSERLSFTSKTKLDIIFQCKDIKFQNLKESMPNLDIKYDENGILTANKHK